MYAGIDIGTSGVKILVYDRKGSVVCQASRSYQELGTKGCRELDPEIVKEKLMELLCEVGRYCGQSIRALAVASLGESVVCLDKNDRHMANSMVTGDARGADEIQYVIDDFGEKRIFEITGLPPNELYGLPKYMWLNGHTDVIRRAEAILFYEDYAGYLLTGKRKVSYTSAARSLAFDIRSKSWSKELLAYAGIRACQMSEPVAPLTVVGEISPEIAEKTGLNPRLKIISGGHDQTCAAIGSGLTRLRTSECGMGTCEFMFLMMPRLQMTEYMIEHDFTCIPYVLEDRYLTSLEVTTCGILKSWAKNTIFSGMSERCREQGKNFYDEIEVLARDVLTEVMVLPQFGSSGNPDLNMNTFGTITGLTIHTKPEEIYRAILESFAFQMRYSYERLKKTGVETDKIIATGGGAKSELTLQIRADVFNIEVAALENEESGTLGCAIMAAAADGAFETIEAAISAMVKYKRTYKPDARMVDYYNEKYKKFEILYEKMHEKML